MRLTMLKLQHSDAYPIVRYRLIAGIGSRSYVLHLLDFYLRLLLAQESLCLILPFLNRTVRLLDFKTSMFSSPSGQCPAASVQPSH